MLFGHMISRQMTMHSFSRRMHLQRASRLFGTKPGAPNASPGKVEFYNEQTALKTIDEKALKARVWQISKLIGYETYDVTLMLVDDDEMKEINMESRGIDAPTDILSFPFHDHVEAGVLEDPEFDIEDYYTLGDLIIDVDYVIRRCEEDREYYKSKEQDGNKEEDDEEERGVSGAMATVFDPEQRLHMLLVHGMLHLVGHDHEEDDEFEIMVAAEEALLEQLGLSGTPTSKSSPLPST